GLRGWRWARLSPVRGAGDGLEAGAARGGGAEVPRVAVEGGGGGVEGASRSLVDLLLPGDEGNRPSGSVRGLGEAGEESKEGRFEGSPVARLRPEALRERGDGFGVRVRIGVIAWRGRGQGIFGRHADGAPEPLLRVRDLLLGMFERPADHGLQCLVLEDGDVERKPLVPPELGLRLVVHEAEGVHALLTEDALQLAELRL